MPAKKRLDSGLLERCCNRLKQGDRLEDMAAEYHISHRTLRRHLVADGCDAFRKYEYKEHCDEYAIYCDHQRGLSLFKLSVRHKTTQEKITEIIKKYSKESADGMEQPANSSSLRSRNLPRKP